MPQRHIIDIEHWERKEMLAFFKSFLDSTVSITSEVACGKAFARSKQEGTSFSIRCMYAVLKAANTIRELRYRIEDEGNIVTEYDRIDALTPIKVNSKGKFVEAYIEYNPDYTEFYRAAEQKIRSMNEDSDPYEFANTHPDYMGVMNISITPGLYFTAVKPTQRRTYGNDYPLSNIGKAIRREGELVIPIAITVNHALTDGYHLTQFFRIIEDELQQ